MNYAAALALFFGALAVIGIIRAVSIADSRIDEESDKW